MNNMFCFQCEQAAAGKACTKIGVCGKSPDVSHLQDELTCALIGLAYYCEENKPEAMIISHVMESLFVTITNVNFSPDDINIFIKRTRELSKNHSEPKYSSLWSGDKDIVSLRSTLLLGMRGMASYAWHAHVLGYESDTVNSWVLYGLRELFKEHTISEWLDLLMDFGMINLKCMELLDKANTETYGHPEPTTVSMTVEKGPFIVVSGHDLLDLKILLEQTDGKGVNIYTHGEMLPAHGYPELKKFSHLKGNFGTAWQNQKKEFHNVPCVFLFTTNCLMPPKDSYSDRVYTTAMVGYPGLVHIPETNGTKDFTEIINKAIALGGWDEDKNFTGINGGTKLITGFGHNAVLSNADAIVSAVKEGLISRFFLVGGCDGAKPGRNYYTDFVIKSPKDSIILTLACGKFRFNDIDLGSIGPFPRIMDVGQCNDAYSAIQITQALADAFECGINDLPLTFILSWYEQKAVCILLTLLALGIKNIYIGPSIPAFFSENVLSALVDKFNLTPISDAESDLAKILGS